MTTRTPAHLEQTTTLALHEKGKLVKSLRRFDMVLFTVCAFVGLDTLGTVASERPAGIRLARRCSALLFVFPYALLMAEAGSTFTEEGGPYEWMKLAWGRFVGGIGAVFYWVTNPLWVGGSLAFISTDAWRTNVSDIGHGTLGDYSSSSRSSGSRSASRSRRCGTASGSRTSARSCASSRSGSSRSPSSSYGIEHGFHGFSAHDARRRSAVFIGLVPVLLFNYVGFELQNGAAEEMENPSRDVPVSVVSRRPSSACSAT